MLKNVSEGVLMPVEVETRPSRTNVRLSAAMLLGFFTLVLVGCSTAEAVPSDPDALLEAMGPADGALKIIAMAGGLLLLVAGWKIYRFVVAFPGFLLAAGFGATFMDRLVENDWISLALVLVLGLVGAWLALKLHDIAIFIIGAVGGGYLAFSLWPTFVGDEATIFIIVAGVVIGGALMLLFGKLWMVLFSAAAGAVMFIWGLGSYTALVLPLFLVGILIQYGASSGKKRSEEYEE